MATLSPFVRQFIKTASYIGIVQGIAWTIFAVLVILVYSEAWVPKFDVVTCGHMISSTIVGVYAYVLLVFAIFYGLASFVWTLVSYFLLQGTKLKHDNNSEELRKRCTRWSRCTILICVMDFVLTCILACDYNYIGQLNLTGTGVFAFGTYIVLAIGVLVTLTARGFVLWIVNLTFAAVLYKLPTDPSQVISANQVFAIIKQHDAGEPLKDSETGGRKRKNTGDDFYVHFLKEELSRKIYAYHEKGEHLKIKSGIYVFSTPQASQPHVEPLPPTISEYTQEMAALSPFVRKFIITASYIGIVQGIAWTIFAFLVILLYSEAWIPKYDAITYGQTLSSVIVLVYAYDNPVNPVLSNLSITATVLLVFAIFYGLASVIWTLVSYFLLQATELKHDNNHEELRKRCRWWSYCTILICLEDFVLTCILASDYNYAVGQLNLGAVGVFFGIETYIVLAIGVLMTLAARGFVLWIVNLTFAAVLYKLPIDSSQVMPEV